MGILRRAFEAVTMIGLGNTLALTRYTREKREIDRAQGPAEPFPWEWPAVTAGQGGWAEVGPVSVVRRTERGLEARFATERLTLSLLAPDLLEVTWRPPLEGLPLPEREWPAIAFDYGGTAEGWALRTASLEVRLSPDGRLRLYDARGRLVRDEEPPLFAGAKVCHRVRLAPGERLHGLGERTSPVDLRGGRYRMWNRDPGGAYGPGDDPIYLCIPVYLSRPAASGAAREPGSPGGYLAFYANPFPALFDLGRTDSGVLEHRFAGGGLRYYVVPGRADQVLERYADLTGRAPLPPLWALGYHQCRWSYYPEARVRQLAADFARHDIPADAIHLDIHYMDGYRVFTVDRRRFPDLKGLAEDLGRQGLHLAVIVDPGVKVDPGYFLYRDGRERGVFCTLPGGETATAPVWPGRCAFPDFTSPRAREWWGSQFASLLEQGVSGFWQDMNEPSAFVSQGDPTLPLPTRHALGDHRAVHNLYGLGMDQAAYEGLRKLDPAHRPFLVSRSGWAGVQRYAWVWTADVRSDWACLKQTIPTVIGLGLSGIPFSGSDVGGFNGKATPELYIRWLQMSAFMPFFRSHTMIATPDQEPWSYGEPYTAIARDFIRLRYALLPYVYSLAWEASRTGRPPVRPLFWDGAGGDWETDDAFLLGEALLVAPVVEKGGRERDVPAPPGVWYDFWTGQPVTGPTHAGGRIRLPAPLERIPLLVRGGCVVPLEEPAPSTAARAPDRLYLHIYPPAAGEEGVSRLYLDAGDGDGPGRVDVLRLRREGGRLVLAWEQPTPAGEHGKLSGEGERAYPWPYREVVLVPHGVAWRGVTAEGQTPAVDGDRVRLSGPVPRVVLELGD